MLHSLETDDDRNLPFADWTISVRTSAGPWRSVTQSADRSSRAIKETGLCLAGRANVARTAGENLPDRPDKRLP